MHSDPEEWGKREVERWLAEEAKKIQEIMLARDGRYILRGIAAPYGTFKYISVWEADGAFVCGPFIYDILDYLLRNDVVRLEEPHTQRENVIYRLVG